MITEEEQVCVQIKVKSIEYLLEVVYSNFDVLKHNSSLWEHIAVLFGLIYSLDFLYFVLKSQIYLTI